MMVIFLDKRTGRTVFRLETPEGEESPFWTSDPEQKRFEVHAFKKTVRFQYK